MKSESDTKRSRNARLNQVHKHACALAAWANPEKRPKTDAEWSGFFANMRDAVYDLSQAMHESAAYNNVLIGKSAVED